MIEAEQKGAASLGGLVRSFVSEARAAGATRLEIGGHSVVNSGFFSPRLTARYGFRDRVRQLTDHQPDDGASVMDSRFYAERLGKQFLRWSGGETHVTRLFDSHPVEVRAEIVAKLQLGADEVGVVAIYFGPRHWVVLTTERIAMSSASDSGSYSFTEIADVTMDPRKLATASGGKLGASVLSLRLERGGGHELQLEAGPPLFGFWNAAKSALARARAAT